MPYDIDARADHAAAKRQAIEDDRPPPSECPFCGLPVQWPGDFCSVECQEEAALEAEADAAVEREKEAKP